jgi:hypothetical protein
MAKRAAKAKTKKAPATTKITGTSATTGGAKPMTTAEAGRITGQLLGHLKNVQISYLRFAKLLARVRDEKIYEVLKHDDVISYAVEHLALSKASAYRYLQVYDWVKANHPKWLEKKCKERIPELSDALDLMQIEKSLKQTTLTPKKRKALDALKDKALEGELTTGNVAAARKGRRVGAGGIPRMLSYLRSALREGKKYKDTPPDTMALLEKLIGMLESYQTLKLAGLGTHSRWANKLLGSISAILS